MNQANLFPLIKHHFHTNDGGNANGYKLYIYQNLTQIPIETYKDNSASVENTHPIVLNSRGECDLWVKPNRLYSALLKSRDNRTIFLVDNIWVPDINTEPVEDSVNKYSVGLTNEIAAPSFNTTYSPKYALDVTDVTNGYNSAYNPATGYYTFFEDGDYTVGFSYTGQVTGTGVLGAIQTLIILFDETNAPIKQVQMTNGNAFLAEGSRSTASISVHMKAKKGQKIIPVVIANGTASTANITTINSSFYAYRIHKETESGGSGADNELKYLATMPPASIVNSLAFNQTGTSLHFTAFKAICDMKIEGLKMETYVTQTANGEMLMAIYDQTYNLIAYTSIALNPSNGYLIRPIISNNVENLTASTHYYLAVLTNINNLYLGGTTATSTLNHTPRIAMKFDNINSMTPPTTLTGGSESVFRYYIGVKK